MESVKGKDFILGSALVVVGVSLLIIKNWYGGFALLSGIGLLCGAYFSRKQ